MATIVRAKDPDVPATYAIDTFQALVAEARRSRNFPFGAVVRAQRDTGFYYQCTVAGRTKSVFPDWPTVAEETVLDGSVQWTTKHPDDVTPPTLSSVVWTVPAALTVDSQEEVGHIARVTLSGGVAGEDYEVIARITPTVGNPRDATLVVPVRHQ